MTAGMPHGSGQRAWLIVAMREIVVRLTNRAFIVSTLVTLAIIAGSGAWSVWQANRTTTHTIAITGQDAGRLVAAAATTAREADEKVEVKALVVSDAAAARRVVESGDATAWLHETAEGWVLTSVDGVDTGLRTAL